jgi:hypothetical protein
VSDDHLVEIQDWLKAGPKVGCLLCVGKIEELKWLTREVVRLRAIAAAFGEAPTNTSMPAAAPLGAAAWNALLVQVVSNAATAFAIARREVVDAHATERRVLDAIRRMKRAA